MDCLAPRLDLLSRSSKDSVSQFYSRDTLVGQENMGDMDASHLDSFSGNKSSDYEGDLAGVDSDRCSRFFWRATAASWSIKCHQLRGKSSKMPTTIERRPNEIF